MLIKIDIYNFQDISGKAVYRKRVSIATNMRFILKTNQYIIY